MRVVSLFSGAGGLDLGFIRAGHEVVWANDLYGDAVETYRKNIGNHIVCNDIHNIDVDDIPDCDIVIGGFPCQGFSVANTKRHADDERNELYKQLIRVIREKRPKFFLAENVKGITNLEKGKVFEMILTDFTDMGYKVTHRILNAADYGVPQTRLRVFIVGVRNDIDWAYEYPSPSHVKGGTDLIPDWVSVSQALAGLPDPDGPNDIPNHTYSKYKLNINGYIGHRLLDPEKPAPTVTARGDSKGGVVIHPHPNGQRRMSCRELATIQSFPLDYAFVGNNSSVYRQIGNAVPPLLAYAVAKGFNRYAGEWHVGEKKMFDKSYVPRKPFPEYKWKWACLQCTEGINDPVVLLGVLFRMRKLEGHHLKYSSQEFADELVELSNDVSDSVGIDLARRTGDRNLIRNSGQYWRALGLIPQGDRSGEIRLTEFGRKVADREISQTEFSAITVQTFKLPNPMIQSREECLRWENHGLELYPLKLILSVIRELCKVDEGYLTPEELTRIIIPLSAVNAAIEDYVNFICWYRNGEIDLAGWPDCCEGANDFRIAREFLLFLSNYGYLIYQGGTTREDERYYFNALIGSEIFEILDAPAALSRQTVLDRIRTTDIVSEVERKRVQGSGASRPNQPRFRKEVLKACQRCVITNVTMPEVLEAAHIKPYKYNGEDTIANGLAMRTDIYILFDSGHLRISETGVVELSNRARMDYGAIIPPRIVIPDFINRDFIRWRWDNYNGI